MSRSHQVLPRAACAQCAAVNSVHTYFHSTQKALTQHARAGTAQVQSTPPLRSRPRVLLRCEGRQQTQTPALGHCRPAAGGGRWGQRHPQPEGLHRPAGPLPQVPHAAAQGIRTATALRSQTPAAPQLGAGDS